MNFSFNAEQEKFRQEIRRFMAERLPEDWLGMFGHPEHLKMTRELSKEMAARGWLTLSWPEEYGGQEGDVWTQAVFREEMFTHLEPRGPQYQGLNFIGPSIMRFGTDEQKQQYLPRIARGDMIWCQSFSEPNAGSDLAAVACRAARDGDDYVINGRKIWISYADIADATILIARTDPEAPKHAGLSVFLVDMATPGIEVRKIPNMFRENPLWCEVAFNDVRVPLSSLLHQENDGWKIAVAALDFERSGPTFYALARRMVLELARYCRETEVNGKTKIDDGLTRRRLADAMAEAEGTKLLNYQVTSMQSEGSVSNHEASMARAASGLLEKQIGGLGMAVLGRLGRMRYPDRHAFMCGFFELYYRYGFRATVTSGAIQIQRNIIAQRGLQMPRV